MPDAAPEVAPDLDAYFARIGYGGRTEPTVQTLAGLQRSHLAHIPFESIDAFIHRWVSIEPEHVDDKLIARRRGGMCFENAALFRRVLVALGYAVTSLGARGIVGGVRPRAHHLLKVRAEDEDWLVEVGNGAATPTAPLQWRYDVVQHTPHGAYRLLADGIETVLDEERDGVWQPTYSVSPDPQIAWDFLPGNYWTTVHPTSFYRRNLVCTLAPENARVLLLNNKLTVRRVGQEDEIHILDAQGMEQCLSTVFGMQVEPIWRPQFQRAVELGAAGDG